MKFRHSIILHILIITTASVYCAVVVNDGDVDEQGLYSKSDHVEILTHRNFARKIYGQDHALVVQFYNSYCGHCQNFAPKFKTTASEIAYWKNIIKLAAIDCSVEENNEICRQFEVMAYPSLRYLHEHYVMANTNVGDKLTVADTSEKFKAELITKMITEQSKGQLRFAPSFSIGSYSNYRAALKDMPSDILFTFLVLENDNSTIGSNLALDINDYQKVRVRRVYETSELAAVADIKHFPGLIAVTPSLQPTLLTPKESTKDNLLKAINTFLKSKNYKFPARNQGSTELLINDHSNEKPSTVNTDLVYYSDLEKTIKLSLHTEITRFKVLSGEPLQALLSYLDILIGMFPARGNLKEYLVNLRTTLLTKSNWSGSEVYDLVKQLENTHAPVYVTNLEYVRCRGSQPKFRGYTCGLWTLFHTLTVNAVQKTGTEGPKVLKAMHGYVKHFFGCTECATHFQAMAERNRIDYVKENDKAVLWLWISHNEVNLRLAGEVTEDPDHPKIQFPSVASCPGCRLARGAWNLPAVYEYLQNIYGAGNIQMLRQTRSPDSAASPFSNLDIGMLSLLYILSFIILILVIKFFLSKRYKKKTYKHDRSKV